MADGRDATLRELFALLARAGSEREASAVEREIWSAWLATDDEPAAPWIARGLAAMEACDFAAALEAFDRVVELAPDYAEGWNKRATLHWLRGAFEESVADIDRTLALEPRHFGALSGLAMIREAQGRPFEALEALEKLLHIHPRLPQLRERIEQLSARLGEAI
ncbi:MAG TPA: tetratricopeptide repeat protein [Myxococcota bacterium]|nr:tetratricopeptide repeat protein [Myxococcota bacterium]